MSLKEPKQAIFVIGAGRSGTSTITRALQAMGVDLGDHFKKASRKNPKGFFEDADLLAISKKARRVLGLRADSVRFIDRSAFDDPRLVALQDDAIEVIQKRFGQSPIWGFKYGRTLRILPFWDRILRETHSTPAFLIALRNPISVAQSRKKIDPRRGRQAASDLEWLMSIVPFLRHTRAHRLVVVDYDDLMDTPLRELTRIARELDLPLGDQGDEKIRAFVDGFLDQSLRHNRFNASDLDAAPELNPIVRDAYPLLKQWTWADKEVGFEDQFWADWANIETQTQSLKPILALMDQKEADWRKAISSPLGPLQAWQLIKPWFKQ